MSNPNKKCFTITWTIENISFCLEKSITSPTFTIRPLQGSEYYLNLDTRGFEDDDFLEFFFHKLSGTAVRIVCELEILSRDGSVLVSKKREMDGDFATFTRFKERNEVFDIKRSIYLPQDKLTVRLRLWKSEGEMTEDVKCFVRTRICIENYSFLWNIKNFSNLQSEEKHTYQIKSILNDKLLLTVELFSKNTYTDEDLMTIQLVDENGKIKHLKFYVTLLNGAGGDNKSVRKEFTFGKIKESKWLTLPFSKNELISLKNLWLPNDILTLRCDCTYSTGKVIEEIESVNYDCHRLHASDSDNHWLDERNSISASKRVLNGNLKDLFVDGTFSDIKLKTNNKTYFANKSILSARSPVFKTKFEDDTQWKFKKSVNIEDLDSDTVYRMLQYIYTAEIEDLQWENACNLYRAAVKYEILALREECSAFLKSNLCPKNARKVLFIADMHQDEELKAAVQDYILNHEVENSDSEEWKQLMKDTDPIDLKLDPLDLELARMPSNFQDNESFSPDLIYENLDQNIPLKFNEMFSEINSRTRTIYFASPGSSSYAEVEHILEPSRELDY